MCYYWIKVAALHQSRGQIYLMEGASSCHGYYLYTLFCFPPKESAATWLCYARSVCMQYLSPESGLCSWSDCTVSWHVVPGTCPTGGYPARNSTIIYCTFCVCVCVRSHYVTTGAHTLLWCMCSVTSGVGSSFSLLATLESEEATSTSWTQFWSLLIYVSLFFLGLNKCIKVRYNVWAFHSASESSEISPPLSSEDSQFWFLGFLPFSTLHRQSQLTAV